MSKFIVDALACSLLGAVALGSPPVGTPTLTATRAGNDAVLTWSALPDAPLYDVVRGGLNALHAGGFQSTSTCVRDDRAGTTTSDPAMPPAGDGFWYLVRGVNCDGNGTYDTGTEVAPRDAAIEATGHCSLSGCVLGTDSDGDRLDDCYENDSGLWCNGLHTGTDPNLADTDGDEIDDGDEVLGTLAGLDLPALGAHPLRRDLFLEYDWFDDANECAAHTHRPTQAMMDRVAASYLAAPNVNVDGSTGVFAHQDRGQGAPFIGGNLVPDADGVLQFGVNSGEFVAIKTASFAPNRNGYFHYVLLPHRYNVNSSSSGQAEILGDDLIVSLYCSISTVNVGNTIVHELGHNLNLRHGGNTNCNYKPNYNSVMNYKYQFPGVDTDCTPPGNGLLDYSRGTRITLNESALNENAGICGSPSWDWNGNSVIENPVSFDVNSLDTGEAANCGGTLTVLSDYNDWANVRFDGLGDADFRFGPREIVDCDNPAPQPSAPRPRPGAGQVHGRRRVTAADGHP